MKEAPDDSSAEMSYDAAYVSDTTCPTCFAEFLDEEDLEIHVKQMHAAEFELTKVCQLCPMTHTDDLEYAAHVRDVHLMDLRGCQYCAKLFTDVSRLKLHEKRHISDENRFYACTQCNSMYKDTFSLQFHERNMHDNHKDGILLGCMQYLSSILCLNAVKLVQLTGKKVFQCVSCQFTSVSLLAYIAHFKISQCESFVCDQCAEVFKSRKNLLRHFMKAKRCYGNHFVDEMVICNDCGKSIQPRAMVFHLKSCTALRCVDCSQIFQTINELSDHQTKEHPQGMDLIKCKYCFKEFIGQEPLKKHVARVHKPTFHLYKYQCKECDAIFQHPQKLFAHYFTQHKEIHPFHCKICDKTFRVRKGFSLHIKLDHKSVGFVEFDEQYRVYFTDKKSDKPFVPKCIIPEDEFHKYDDDDDSQDYIQLQDDDTDRTDAETEDDEPPVKQKVPPKPGKTKKTRKTKPVPIYSSDEEPLLVVRKRALKKKSMERTWSWKKPKSQFMCDICKINCYTFQNHQNHLRSHYTDQNIECIKCSKMFNTQSDLTRHISTEHVTSKLTETLKNLLQKKKQGENIDDATEQNNITKAPRFKIAMTKVDINKSEVAAKITPVESGISVRNFLENFTPDVTESKNKPELTSSVSIKPYRSPFFRQSTIKLTRFKDEPIYERVPLRMPERFKDENYVKTKITIKMVQKTYKPSQDFILPDVTEMDTGVLETDYTDAFQDHDYTDDRDENNIPEVAQEVSLVGTEEPQEEMTKIIIPKMPEGYKKIHIATLQSEAPYYKIIKVDSDNLQAVDSKPTTTSSEVSEVFDLGGTRLVTANPLAHLLGDSIDKIMEPIKNKYYKPPKKDYQGMLAKAMKKLDEAPPRKPRARKKNGSEAKNKKEKDSNKEVIDDIID